MSEQLFASLVKRITEGNLPLIEVIGAADPLRKAGQQQQASQLYSIWIQYNPNDSLLPIALFNMACLLTDQNDLQGAKQALERAIERNPDFYPPYINLGTLLERLGNPQEALNKWHAMVNRTPQINGNNVKYKLEGLRQIGRVLENNHMLPNAEVILKQSLDINPTQHDVAQHFTAMRMAQCEWPVIHPFENVTRKHLMKGTGPLSMSIYADDPILQLAAGWNYCRNFIGYPTVDLINEHKAQPKALKGKKERRKIGYVSSDLRNHAIGFIMAELFECHNRDDYEITAYYCGIAPEDSLKDRIRKSVDRWVDLREMSDEQAARKIVEDGIEILIDVNGYTKDARTKMFGMRPAPIIVNWLGYPGSMGSPYHHYIIADEWIIPKENEKFFSEKVLRLPCYQPNDRKRMVSLKKPTRQEAGLPEDAFVFMSFNGAQKISRFTFDRWMQILNRVPNSVLWLLEATHAATTTQRLRDEAKKRGVDPSRLVFAPKAANPDHVARYALADLFLDNQPYGAHVTASDALWMGVPLLTFPGRGFAARVCSGLVRAAGIPEMVVQGPQEFIERAVELATTKKADLAKIRKKLADNRSTCVLFDTDNLVRHLEKLFDQMWEDYASGNLPKPNLTNMEVYLDIGSDQDYDATEAVTVADFPAHYLKALTKRHNYCALPPDALLWDAKAIAKADADSAKARYSGSGEVVELSTGLKKKKR